MLINKIKRYIEFKIFHKNKKSEKCQPINEPQEVITQQPTNSFYKRKMLLTQHELHFYKQLLPIANELNLHIITKIRLADLIEFNQFLDRKTYYTEFNKIKAKHIDFALCEPENLNVVLLIELDDSTHKRSDRIERDNFVDGAVQNAGYKIIHYYTGMNLNEYIKYKLDLINPVQQDSV